MEAFALSDVGLCREINQDVVYSQCAPIGNLSNLFVVADGMGGHQAGDYAAACAIERLRALIEADEDRSIRSVLERAYSQVNREIYEKGYSSEELYGMGTTLVSCTISRNHVLTVANVGDSRLYVYSQAYGLRQITRDHSYVEELVRKGQITRESDLYRRSKNVITRAIGAAEEVKTDIFQLEVESGMQILLCSDGLTNMVEDPMITLILSDKDSTDNKVRRLVEEANFAGGIDNISALLIRLEADDFEEESSGETTEDQKMRGLQ